MLNYSSASNLRAPIGARLAYAQAVSWPLADRTSAEKKAIVGVQCGRELLGWGINELVMIARGSGTARETT